MNGCEGCVRLCESKDVSFKLEIYSTRIKAKTCGSTSFSNRQTNSSQGWETNSEGRNRAAKPPQNQSAFSLLLKRLS